MDMLNFLKLTVWVWAIMVYVPASSAGVPIANIPDGKVVVTKDDAGRQRYTKCVNNWCTTSYQKSDVEDIATTTKQGGSIPVIDYAAIQEAMKMIKSLPLPECGGIPVC